MLPHFEDLRNKNLHPHYFGLGFIQLKLDRHIRLHFWVPHWPTIPGAESDPHNHRYGFTSSVLKGCVEQDIYHLDRIHDEFQPGDMEVLEVSCQPGQDAEPVIKGFAKLQFIRHQTIPTGQSYGMTPIDFHTSYVTGPTITRLHRSDPTSDTALVLRTPGTFSACPFSIEKSEEECWAEIERMLA